MNRIKLNTAILAIAMAATATSAHAYTLANDNGGDGYVTAITGGFDLFGADNDVGPTLTTYTDVAAAAATLTFNYVYTTNDCCGASWDPAGYIINGSEFQLSPFDSVPGYTAGGSVSFTVNAGDDYGFYVYSVDSVAGRADIAVTTGAVPEPGMWALMLVGFGLVGGAMRRRSVVRVNHAFG